MHRVVLLVGLRGLLFQLEWSETPEFSQLVEVNSQVLQLNFRLGDLEGNGLPHLRVYEEPRDSRFGNDGLGVIVLRVKPHGVVHYHDVLILDELHDLFVWQAVVPIVALDELNIEEGCLV